MTNKDSIDFLIDKLEEEFDDVEKGTIHPNFSFKELPNWGSMHALILIALVDAEYDIILSGTDLKGMETVNDLFELIRSKRS